MNKIGASKSENHGSSRSPFWRLGIVISLYIRYTNNNLLMGSFKFKQDSAVPSLAQFGVCLFQAPKVGTHARKRGTVACLVKQFEVR
jgi:hypothetical protein